MGKLQILRNEVERLKEETGIGLSEHDNGVEQGRMEIINTMLLLIDDMLKEPVSEDLDDQMFAKEMDAVFALPSSETQNTEEEPLNWEYAIAKHFFQLGIKAQQEPVSEDLEKAAEDWDESLYLSDAFKAGANWQIGQFEKNRLTACDAQTEEDAEIERDFTLGIIEKEHRPPTFDDAIKYGMRLKEKQIMANAVDAMIGLPYENKDGGYTHLIDVSRPLTVGKNIIAIIFEED